MTKRKNFSPGAPFPLLPLVALFPPPPCTPGNPRRADSRAIVKNLFEQNLKKK